MNTIDTTPPPTPDVPQPDGSDIVYGLGMAVLSSVPGPLSSIAAMLVRSPMDRRTNLWRVELTKVVEYLIQRLDENSFEALKQNEEFASTILHASRIAIFTHRKEKHAMLRNAVLNSALPKAPEDDERSVFLNFVDEFSVTHIFVLKAFKLPRITDYLGFSLDEGNWRNNAGVFSLFEIVVREAPDTDLKFDLFVHVLSELHMRALISNTHSERGEISRMSHHPELTTFGKRFLDFIESPLDDETT